MPIGFTCSRWCVVTTINAPTKSILQHAALGPKWCLVVVGDLQSPETYELPGCSTCVYLGVEAQKMYLARFPGFGKLLPWNHFGRKNIGYLYAIHHGAVDIWDFDDDNKLLVDDIRLPKEHEEVDSASLLAERVLNPFVQMGASVFPIWPRGFPLDLIKDNSTFDFRRHKRNLQNHTIAVLQSLANHDPDVDAIFRLTQPLPVTFGSESNTGGRILMLPKGKYSPINAQACLFRRNALWMLLLPVTVHGRVSDIWRGYIGQRLLQDTQSHVAFAPPFVVQHRNPHTYLLDFDAELPLYQRSGVLLKFLKSWTSEAKTLPAQMEELAVQLFQRGYIEENDVLLTQQWIKALERVGYEFPVLHPKNPWERVLVLVRFNHGHYEVGERFLQIWQRHFPHIVFFGPAPSAAQKASLSDTVLKRIVPTTDTSNGWAYYGVVPDLIDAHPGHKGYLIMHDDLFIKMEALQPDFDKLWIADEEDPYVDANNRPDRWSWQAESITRCVEVINDPVMEPYHKRMLDQCGFPRPLARGQADLFYIPARLVDEVSTSLRRLYKQGCPLEIAVSTIFRCLIDSQDLETLNLDTSWDALRNTPQSFERCLGDHSKKICHPLKLSNDHIWDVIKSHVSKQGHR